MEQILKLILQERAKGLVHKLVPYLPDCGYILDIGSGTGHTVQALRTQTSLTYLQADVVNMGVVGDGPVLFDGQTLPFADGAFACSLILFVLQFSEQPVRLLLEARRITAGPVLVLQSVYHGFPGKLVLHANEFMWGPVAFSVARVAGLIRNCPFSLDVRRLYTRQELQDVYGRAGLCIRESQVEKWFGVPISDELFVLEQR
jgi:SAM-dependent methyltransferase